MAGYFEKRKKQKLYRQWVEKSGLPPENVPGELEEKNDYDGALDEYSGTHRVSLQSGFTFRLTMRHLLYIVLVIVVLLITTASLATVLIMRSC